MKKFVLTGLLFILYISFAQDYWLLQQSPTTKWLTRIQFVDTLFGWASGDSGTVIHTSNGGQNWIIQNTPITNLPIEDLYFLNRRFGWALSNDYLFNGTKVLSTTNSGTNWQITLFPDTSVIIQTVYFLDSLTGFAGGAFPGRVFKTTNGGNNWFECFIDTAYCPVPHLFPKNNIHFYNQQTGYACGGQFDILGMIWRTTDSGNNWYTYCVSPEPLKRIKALYPHKIIATGGDFEFGLSIVQSLDSGKTWLYDTTVHIFGVGQALAYRTPSELWIPTAFGQSWALSLDSGGFQKPWYIIPTPNGVSVYDAVFMTPTFGWACGYDGVLLKYNSGIIGIANNNNNNNNVPLGSALYQNYPNPFNPLTTISYYLGKKSPVSITIFDILGKVVYKSIEGFKPAGMHKFKFSSFGMASGIYFYQIEAGDFIEAKKMVILK